MPKPWSETVDEHRRAVHDVVLETAAALVAERGVAAVRMSHIAERAGIGRATLYKHFPDVDAVLRAWHERRIDSHLQEISAAGTGTSAWDRLGSVLTRYARLRGEGRDHSGGALVTALHSGEHVARAHRRLHDFVREVLVAAVEEGAVREDVPPDELVGFCLHALDAASDAPDATAGDRLVGLVLAGLRPAPVR